MVGLVTVSEAETNTAQFDFSGIYNADTVYGNDKSGAFDSYAALITSTVAENNGNLGDGLPDDGVFTSTSTHPRIELANFHNDDGYNAWQSTGTGSVTASVTNGKYKTVHLIASAGDTGTGNPAKFEVVLHYGDGTNARSQEFTVPDWYGSISDPGYALKDNMDRWSNDGNYYDNSDDPAIWGFAMQADSTKTLESVTIDVTENQAGSFNFFGGAATTQETDVIEKPRISSFELTNPSDKDLAVNFDSDKQLSTISVSISGPNSGNLNKQDFNEINNGDGTYTYETTYNSNSDGDYTATLETAEDAEGNNGSSGEQDSVNIDTTPPEITGFNVSNPSGQNIFLSFTSNEDLAAISVSITGAESATFTGTDFTETDNGDGTYTYETTYNSNSDGDYTATLENAEDYDGNVASGEQDSVNIDTTPPEINEFNVTNPSGQNLLLNFTSNEDLATISVSITGAESATFTGTNFTETENDDGTFTYNHTYSVSSDGDYTATLENAADPAGNDGASDEQNSVNIDTTPAEITGFKVYNPSGQNLSLNFTSNEDLAAISVSIVGAESATFTGTNFTETDNGDGTYTYNHTYNGSSDGTYTATLETAKDSNGNVASGQQGFVTVITNETTHSDTDGDGILNYLDSDSDDDGIPDKYEGIMDRDKDGIPNYIDSDSDDDGIGDLTEGFSDRDGDGIANSLDTDADEDGILDNNEVVTDSDNDGIPDYLDAVENTGTIISNPRASSYLVESGTNITFDGSNSNVTVQSPTYSWTFSDGSTAQGETVIKNFTSLGIHEAELNVSANNNWDTQNVSVTIQDTIPPIALLDVPPTLNESETGSFNASNSSDSTGIASYEWRFGDGSTATGVNQSHSFDEPGEYTVSVTIEDTSGNKAANTTIVRVTGPEMSLTPKSIGYSSIANGSTATYSLTIENTGNEPLNLTNASFSGDSPESYRLPDITGTDLPVVQSDETITMMVEFAPMSTGEKNATLTLGSNDTDAPTMDIILRGQSLTSNLSATSSTFGEVMVGSSQIETMSVTNNGDVDVDITGVNIGGESRDQFSIISDDISEINSGSSQDLNIEFAPKSTGQKVANLVLTTGSGSQTNLSVSLNGTGIGPDIALPDWAVNFTEIGKNKSKTKQIKVANYGKLPLAIDNVSVIGPDSDQFQIESMSTVASGETENLNVTFSPESAGTFDAELRIKSNDTDETVRTVPVKGTAVGATVNVDTRSYDFGNVTIGDTVTTNITVDNVQKSKTNLTVTNTKLTGRDPEAFTIENGKAPFTLEPGESQRIEVNFTPTTPNPKQAQLQILSDAENEQQIDIWLTNTQTWIIVRQVHENGDTNTTPDVNVDANNVDQNGDLSLNVSKPNTRSKNVSVQEMNMTVKSGGYFNMNLTHATTPEDGGHEYDESGQETIQYIGLTHTIPNSEFDNTSLLFRVNKSSLPENVKSNDVEIHRYSNGWNTLDTKLLHESSSHYIYKVKTPGFSEFVVSVSGQQDDLGDVTDSTKGSDNVYVGQSMPEENVLSTVSGQKFIKADEETQYALDDSIGPVSSISFEPRNTLGRVVAKVQTLDNMPDGIDSHFNSGSTDQSGSSTYSTISITVGTEGTISTDNTDNIQIEFQVTKDWVEENNIDSTTIRMKRYHNGEWNDLPTNKVAEDGKLLHFTAFTPGFSIFTVVGDKIEDTGTGDDKTEPDTKVNDVSGGQKPETETESDKSIPGFTSILTLGVIVAIYLVQKRR